jgi:hypothetical protein
MVMRLLSTALAGALAIGVSAAALAQTDQTRVMSVRLPDGSVAQIRYAGDVTPQVTFGDAPAPFVAWAPMPAFFAAQSPFAMMERISAEMDREAEAMFRQGDALAASARSGQLSEAAMRDLPAGGRSYSFISTMSGNGVCSQSVEITAQGNGAPPRIVRHSSGACGPSGGAIGSADLPAAPAPSGRTGPIWTNAPAPAPATTRPDILWTSAPGAKPHAGLVREIPAAPR